jgi:hypothetical protein
MKDFDVQTTTLLLHPSMGEQFVAPPNADRIGLVFKTVIRREQRSKVFRVKTAPARLGGIKQTDVRLHRGIPFQHEAHHDARVLEPRATGARS